MELSQLATYVGTCAHDAPAPCSGACPFGLDVRAFLKKQERAASALPIGICGLPWYSPASQRSYVQDPAPALAFGKRREAQWLWDCWSRR